MSTPETAACAVHIQQPAVGLCQRCGNYMCAACQSTARRDLCAECSRRVGTFALRRDNFDLMEALAFAWDKFRAQWVFPTVVTAFATCLSIAVLFVTVAAMSAAAGLSMLVTNAASWAFQILYSVVYAVGLSAQARVAVVALEGHQPTGEHVLQGLRRSPGMILAQFVFLGLGAMFSVPSLVPGFSEWVLRLDLVLVIPLAVVAGLVAVSLYVYLALGVFGASLEFVIDPNVRFREAMQRSWQVARGQRLNLLAGVLLGLLVCLAGLVACCVGLFPASAFMTYFWVATYMALRTGVVPSAAPFPTS